MNHPQQQESCKHKKHWVKDGVCEECGGKMCNPSFGETCENELTFISCCTEEYVCKNCFEQGKGCVCQK